ncbi:MAG: pyruvate kinase [Chloroflexota bacterium]
MPNNKGFARKTKIVCTLGPASNTPAMIERLIKAGMNIARLNLSHGTHEEHAALVKTVRDLSTKLQTSVAVLIDLPGPKYRTGQLKNGSVELNKGSTFILTTRAVAGDGTAVSINLPNLPRDVKVGDRVLLDDGAMVLRVLEKSETDVRCRVIAGGMLTPNRGVAVPGMRPSSPFITESFRNHLAFAIKQNPDYIALSFIHSSEDINQARAIIREAGADFPIIPKIERGEALKVLDAILEASDGAMVARGDLGVDIPLKRIPLVQKEIIRKCNRAGKAVITATQMLESMINNMLPTRAEVTDIANAIFDGTDAIMLSGETSIGKYPAQAVTMMAQIAKETEGKLPYDRWLTGRGAWVGAVTDELISYNACYTAERLRAAAIVAFTRSGSTARRVSRYRPRIPILGVAHNEEVKRRLQLYWGVQPVMYHVLPTVDDFFQVGAELALKYGLANPGDLVVITGGVPLGIAGSTNLLKVQMVTGQQGKANPDSKAT